MPWEKQFERDEALSRAEHAFWAGGYEATSMEKLLREMGIQKGSFYATFDSKHDVLIEALNRYILERFASFNALAHHYPPLEALEHHFDDALSEATGALGDRGCFLVNIALELAPRDKAVGRVISKTLEAHRSFYQKLLSAAQADGAFPKEADVASAASVLLGLLLGMRVMARAGAIPAAIRAIRDEAVAVLRRGSVATV